MNAEEMPPSNLFPSYALQDLSKFPAAQIQSSAITHDTRHALVFLSFMRTLSFNSLL